MAEWLAGWWILDAGCWILDAGYIMKLGAGYWVLVTGCWLLGAGSWIAVYIRSLKDGMINNTKSP